MEHDLKIYGPDEQEIKIEEIVEESAKVSDSWVKLISVVGVPSVIALWLVYSFTAGMQADLRNIDRGMAQHIVAADNMTRTNGQILRMLQVICANAAKDNNSRERCFEGN
jgi:hypothetical protein